MAKDDVVKAFCASLAEYSNEKRRVVVHRFFFGCFVAAAMLLTVVIWSQYGTQFGMGFLCAAFISYWIVGRTSGHRRAAQPTTSPRPGRNRARQGRSSRAKG